MSCDFAPSGDELIALAIAKVLETTALIAVPLLFGVAGVLSKEPAHIVEAVVEEVKL